MDGAPRQSVGTCVVPDHVGVYGSDYPDLRLKPVVEEGARVAAGQTLLKDHAHEDLRVVSPSGGVVEEIAIGAKRRVSRIVIRRDDAEPRRFETADANSPEGLRRLLFESGLWTGFLRRPFGRIPAPSEAPTAIIVSASDTEPGAADPALCIRAEAGAFDRGVDALSRLADVPVIVCQGEGQALTTARGSVRVTVFRGAHPAGLPGIQIERLCPVTLDRPVWQIGYGDVIALGILLDTGSLPQDRVVALAGPMVADPRLVRLPLGADIEALAASEARPGPRHVLSGSLLSGQETRFLRRRHAQVTLTPRAGAGETPRRAPRNRMPLRRRALIPHAALSRALGPDFPAVALLRSLSVLDVEQAERLGALGLLEEDMALATYLSGGTEDFGARLRAVLDRIEAA